MGPYRARLLAILILFAATPLAAQTNPRVGPRDDGARERVRAAALVTYFHGISEEAAIQAIGSDGWPELLPLLADPSFPRRDNVVAFLHQLPNARGVEPLLRLIEHPVGDPASVPEDERALLLAPEALGKIAAQADPAALQHLLDATASGVRSGRLARAIAEGPYTEAMRADLVDSALWGLARSGRPEAREHLRSLSEAASSAMVHGLNLNEAARRAYRDFDQFASPTAASLAPLPMTSGGSGPQTSATDTQRRDGDVPVLAVVDPSNSSHDHGLTYANHVNLTSPMTNSQLDAVLAGVSSKAATSDFSGDTSCCLSFSRLGSLQSFGTAIDGYDIVDNETDLNAVFADPIARVKIVRTIRFCAGPSAPNINILGCAPLPGNTMILVRAGAQIEDLLWWHEYGHNVGLDHVSDSNNVMNGTVSFGGNLGLDVVQCDTFHNPDFGASAVLTDTGVCHDDDLDLIASNVDNCPDDDNANQQDTESDGAGDLCDNCPGAFNPPQTDTDNDGFGDACDCIAALEDIDGDGICAVADNCPDDANPGQQDDDGDGIGNACDPCTDVDGDGFGASGGSLCTNPGQSDCNDNLAAVFPGAFDQCDSVDNDCNGGVDNGTCDLYEFSGDGFFDGIELGWLGRSFGLCSATPAAEWWFPVDYSRDGCVDGFDLAIMATIWGCAGVDRICP